MPATRVRAIRCDHYGIADRHPDNGFVDASLRMGRGRSEEQKAATGKAIYDAMRAFCAPLYETQFFALSLEVREIDPDLSWKENGIKPRLQRS
jgi:5-carboxymethyl-2-hydroxymuconate isomerase